MATQCFCYLYRVLTVCIYVCMPPNRSHGLSQGRKSTGGKNVSRTATNVKCPIIIVPSTPNAMLTLYNIKEFLIVSSIISLKTPNRIAVHFLPALCALC